MKMKKVLAVCLLAAMAGGLVSCGGDTNSTSGGSSTADSGSSSSGGEIHVASWNNAADNLKAIADKFNPQFGDKGEVVIDYWDGDYTKLKPALQSGNGIPDIFQTQNRDAKAFYNSYGLKPFLDLSDIMEAEKDNWPGFVWEMCLGEDGKPHAMPWDIGPCAVFYRTDIFEEAGIDPTTLTTWDKYIEAGKKLREMGDYYVADIPYNGTGMDFFMLLLNQLDGEYLDEEGNANFNNPEMVQAAEMLVKMSEAGIICDTPNAWDDRIAAINDNKLVMVPNAAWYMGTMKNSCADSAGKWGIIPLPAFEEGGNTYAQIGGSVLMISSDSENIDQSKEFLKYAMMTNDGNDINMDFGEFPAYTPAYESPKFEEAWDYYGGVAAAGIFTELADAPTTNFGAYFTDVNTAMNQVVGNILAGTPIEEALDAGTQDCQNMLDAH